MKYCVLWSGGLDSTFLIWHLLKLGHAVDAYYVKILNNPLKTKCEEKAIDSIVPLFTNQFFNKFTFMQRELFSITLNYSASRPESSCPQLLTWIYAIPMMINNSASKNNTYYDTDPKCIAALGYVKNDCALSYLDDIRNCLNAMTGITFYDMNKIEFPIIKWSKDDIITALLQDDFGKHLILKTWTCEMPWKQETDIDLFGVKTEKIVECGDCDPCKRRKEWMKLINVDRLEQEEMKRNVKLDDDSLKLPYRTYKEVENSPIKCC